MMLNIHDVWVNFSQVGRQVVIHLDTTDATIVNRMVLDSEAVARLFGDYVSKDDISISSIHVDSHRYRYEQNVQVDSQTGKELFNLWCENGFHIIWINCMECITNVQTISSDGVVHQYRINANPKWVISRLKFLDDESKTAFILLNG